MSEWINIHTHRPGSGVSVVDPFLGEVEVPGGALVLYSAGIHPMFIDGREEVRLEEIEQLALEGKIVAVGEAGLDRNAIVGMERQVKLFVRQADIATAYGLPLIIHGVRAAAELLEEAKKRGGGEGWIIHGFNNRREVMQDFLRHGMCLSLGRQVMNKDSHVWRLLPEIPRERLFLETDHSDWRIEEIYSRVAERLGVEVELLQEIVAENFRRLFHK